MRRLILVIVILALAVIALLYVRSAKLVPTAATKKNNLADVDCKKHDPSYSGKTPIVTNSNDGIAPADEAVFVCTGEKVHWEAGPGVASLDIFFPSAQEWPFKGPFVAKLSGGPNKHTDEQEVADPPPGYRIKAFKYQIHVVTGARTIDLDPHVIPMGP